MTTQPTLIKTTLLESDQTAGQEFMLRTAGIFDVYKWSNYSGLNKPIDELLSLVIQHRAFKGIRIRNRTKVRSHLKTTLINLFIASELSTNPFIGVSKNKSDYQSGSRNWKIFLSYDYLIPIINDLAELGFVEQIKGSQGTQLRTRIKATQKLIDLIYEPRFSVRKAIDSDGVLSIVCNHPQTKHDLITLKDENDKPISFKETKDIRLMKSHIEQINAKLKNTLITLKMTDEQFDAMENQLTSKKDIKKRSINFTNTHLYRIFNNSSFDLGGRFYGGWWQNVPSQYRKYIEINHKPTVEIDYSSHHIRILYDQEGLDAPDDAYAIEGYDRDSLKEIMLIMINCRSRRQAMAKLLHMDDIDPELAKAMAQSLIEKHQPIRRHFYSGIGLSLMYKDSVIAEQVMLEMLKRGATVLPVHDSFIVRNSYEQELREIMEAVYLRIHNNEPKAKVSETALEEQAHLKPRTTGTLKPSNDDLEETLNNINANYQRFQHIWGRTSW
jgi:hypothetical protein